MNTNQPITPAHQAALTGLAVVGFVALVALGIWLAVSSTRFVPGVVNRVGSAAVYLGSLFVPAEGPTITVVPSPTASTTIAFGTASSTISTPITSTSVPKTPSKPKPIATVPGTKTGGTYQIGTGTTVVLSGNPDFFTSISSVGYLATSSADSFVASSTVPVGMRPAVRFTIKNIGTNRSGEWRFSASIPTQSAYLYYSPFQQSLNPGESIDYTLGFDQSNKGSGQTISVSANFDHAVTESNYNNNGASANLTIIGG